MSSRKGTSSGDVKVSGSRWSVIGACISECLKAEEIRVKKHDESLGWLFLGGNWGQWGGGNVPLGFCIPYQAVSLAALLWLCGAWVGSLESPEKPNILSDPSQASAAGQVGRINLLPDTAKIVGGSL